MSIIHTRGVKELLLLLTYNVCTEEPIETVVTYAQHSAIIVHNHCFEFNEDNGIVHTSDLKVGKYKLRLVSIVIVTTCTCNN